MGFTPKKQGIKPTASTPTQSAGTSPGLTTPPFEPKVTNADAALSDKKYVINTQNNATAVNMQRLQQVVYDLKGFVEGSPLVVTYYKEHYSETDVKGKSKETEYDAVHNAHNSVLKIHDFELRLTGPLSYEHDTEDNNSVLTGEAFTYPGFAPEEGDRFVMEIDHGKYAMMQVDKPPTRMSIRAATYFKISFHLESWMTEETQTQLNKTITDEAWFDKTRFLAEPGALLVHDEYVEINFLEKQRALMINYYHTKFLDELLMYSYMRPDGVYDPYVTDFMTNVLNFNESGQFATQLFEQAPFLNESIWTAIFNANTSLHAVPTSTAISTYVLGSKSVMANSLINKKYLFWKPSASLQDYLDSLDEYDAKFKLQVYPTDFEILTTEYVLTQDHFFIFGKDYYVKKDDGTYEKADVVVGKVIPVNTYYETKHTYGFKPDVKYYYREDGLYHLYDTTGQTPDPTKKYYCTDLIGGGGIGEEGTIPADPSIQIPGAGTLDEERTLGDLLLHLHPHYTECPMMSDADAQSTGTTGEGLGLVLEGSNDYVDLIRGYLKDRSINLQMLHRCIESVWKLPLLQQFYKMAVYIWLADQAVKYIRHQCGIFDVR